jgi:hypothetical protein
VRGAAKMMRHLMSGGGHWLTHWIAANLPAAVNQGQVLKLFLIIWHN